MINSIDIIINGNDNYLSSLFSFSKETQGSGLTSLSTFMSHFFNETLSRDGFFGAWAMVWKIDDYYNLKLSSPHHDLRIYKEKIPAFIEAGKLALDIYSQNLAEIEKVVKLTGKQIRFMLPWGLSLARPKSIQLLHFLPIETFVYLDYLFSPTNRRWENLLGYNRFSRVKFAQLESIVDCVPLAAAGGDNAGINLFNEIFSDYVKKMLASRLTPENEITQPVVAYGGPVMEWLQKSFPNQIKGYLEPLSLINIELFDHTKTPILCANHPSKYLYFAGQPDSEEKKEILIQDLVAAGWQASMSRNPTQNPEALLDQLLKFWKDNLRLAKIMRQEDQAFAYKY